MNKEQLIATLKRSVSEWNELRDHERSNEPLDLCGINLTKLNLVGADLTFVNLSGSDISLSDVRDADLSYSDLSGTNLTRTKFSGTKFIETICDGANFTEAGLISVVFSDTSCRHATFDNADLTSAYFGGCDCTNATFDYADLQISTFSHTTLVNANLLECQFSETILTAVNLSGTSGLTTIRHEGYSTIDFRTLQLSGQLPIIFLRGAGFTDRFIENISFLIDDAVQLYSCFISYSSKDSKFARKLHADLLNKGIRCWFAPHDLPVGAKIWDSIDSEIKLRDKLLIILSRNSIRSNWVEDEINKAFAEERRRNSVVLIPIRVDGSIFQTNEPWAQKVKDQRNIGDFCKWKDDDKYKTAIERLIRDLRKNR